MNGKKALAVLARAYRIHHDLGPTMEKIRARGGGPSEDYTRGIRAGLSLAIHAVGDALWAERQDLPAEVEEDLAGKMSACGGCGVAALHVRTNFRRDGRPNSFVYLCENDACTMGLQTTRLAYPLVEP